MKHLTFTLITAAVLSLGTREAFRIYVSATRPTFPPPGYEVACDGHGHYCMAVQIGENKEWTSLDVFFHSSRQTEIDWEWRYVEWEKSKVNDSLHAGPAITCTNIGDCCK